MELELFVIAKQKQPGIRKSIRLLIWGQKFMEYTRREKKNRRRNLSSGKELNIFVCCFKYIIVY